MRRLVLITLGAALIAAPAQAVTKNDVVTATVHKSGKSGTALVYKGTVHSKVFGTGTVVQKVYSNLTGTFVITYKKGKTMGTTTTKIGSVSNGKVNVTGTFKLTGGTGKYKHVSGHGTYKGSSNASQSTASFRQVGAVTF
ncbi:MAG: hypothetical protein ACJ762_14070 [Solirubrobacteraceae bacterium]